MSILSAIFGSTPPKEIRLGELIQEINDDKVDYIKVYGNNLDIKLKNGEKQKSRKEAEGTLSETLNNSGVSAEKIASIIEVEGDSNLSIFLNTVLPLLLPFVIFGLFLWNCSLFSGTAMTNKFS